MSIEFLSILFVAVFAVTLLTGLPLAFATGAVAVVFAVALFGLPGLTLIVSRMYTLMGNYVLVSVPLFIFMACILERAGIAEAIFRAVHVWSGRLRGGLAVAVIISCALMATMVGVIGAEIVTMGVVALPAMLEQNYKKDIALGCICAGGGLATLIPPSVVFIMYGLTAGVSIGQLYMAGVVPGPDAGRLLHRLHHRPLQAISPSWRRPPRPRSGDAAAREARAAEGADPSRDWSRSACSARSTWAGPRRPRRPASASSARCSPRSWNRKLAGRASARAVVDTTKVTVDAVLAVLRLVGADRRLHARRRHPADPGRDDDAAARSRST